MLSSLQYRGPGHQMEKLCHRIISLAIGPFAVPEFVNLLTLFQQLCTLSMSLDRNKGWRGGREKGTKPRLGGIKGKLSQRQCKAACENWQLRSKGLLGTPLQVFARQEMFPLTAIVIQNQQPLWTPKLLAPLPTIHTLHTNLFAATPFGSQSKGDGPLRSRKTYLIKLELPQKQSFFKNKLDR